MKNEISTNTIINNLKTKIMEMEKFYVAPEVEVLEVAVEKGFEGSTGMGGDGQTPEIPGWD